MSAPTLEEFRQTRHACCLGDIPAMQDYGFESSDFGFVYKFDDSEPNTFVIDSGANVKHRYDTGCPGAFETLEAAEAALYQFLMGEVFGVFKD